MSSEDHCFILKWGLLDKFFYLLPDSLKEKSSKVIVSCAITTQGINDQQSIAICRNQTKIQESINQYHIHIIEQYFYDFRLVYFLFIVIFRFFK